MQVNLGEEKANVGYTVQGMVLSKSVTANYFLADETEADKAESDRDLYSSLDIPIPHGLLSFWVPR